jgi:hypothetical protein
MVYNQVKVQYGTNSANPSFPAAPTNVTANPQPGDQTVQDIFQNIFDNWNKKPGTYALAGVETATDGTRTALTPATLNQGVLDAFELVYGTNSSNATFPADPTQQLKPVQPLYENLNYTRYIVQYATNSNNSSFPGAVTNVEDPVPFKQDAFDYDFIKVQYTTNSNNASFPSAPSNVAGRVPLPYQQMRVQYAVNAFNPSFPGIPSNVDQSVKLSSTETVLLNLSISADPDSPYLTLEDDIHSLALNK